MTDQQWDVVGEVNCHRCKKTTPLYRGGHEAIQMTNAIAAARGWPRQHLDKSVLCNECLAFWADFMRAEAEKQYQAAKRDLDGFVACALADGESVAWASYRHRLDDAHWCDRARAILEARKGKGRKAGGF